MSSPKTSSFQTMFTPVALASMGATAGMLFVAFILAKVLSSKCKLPRCEMWVLLWVIWDGMMHLFVDGPYVVVSLTGSIKKSNHWSVQIWKEYGKADARFLSADPSTLALETQNLVVCSLLCLILIVAICRGAFYRHFIQIVLCVCELVGGWMSFGSEWLTGSPSLSTSNWVHLWIYLVFFNGLWVIIPLLLLYQSWNAIHSLHIGSDAKSSSAATARYNLRSKAKKAN